MDKEDFTDSTLAEGLKKLDLGVDGAEDTATKQEEKRAQAARSRYNLRSRNKTQDSGSSKPSPTTHPDSSTGTKQDTLKTYTPPHQRTKDTHNKTTTREFHTDNSEQATHQRTRRPRGTRNNKKRTSLMQLTHSHSTCNMIMATVFNRTSI